MRSVSFQLTLLLLVLGVVLLPQPVRAVDVSITEVMYSPSGPDAGNEWVEVHNQSDKDIRLTDWSLRENEVDHRISSESKDILPANGRVIIADNPQKVRNAYPQVTSPVFDSTFSLNNDGEAIALINSDGQEVDSLRYDPAIGANGDENSLQLSSGRWLEAAPTPQKANADKETSADSDDANTSDDSEADSASRVLDPRPEQPESQASQEQSNQTENVRVDAGDNLHAIAGTQLHLEGVATTSIDGTEDVEVFWSLGNGNTKQSDDIFYMYKHPGNYVATLVYRSDEHNKTDQITVNVASPGIHITDRKTGSDGYTKISNGLRRDVNLSGWHLRSENNTKTLPDYTIALSDSTLTLDNEPTQIQGESVQLLYPNGTVADTYEPDKSTSSQASTSNPTNDSTDERDERLGAAATVAGASNQQTDTRNTESTSSDNQIGSLFTTSSQTAAAGQTGDNNFWRWAILTAFITLGGVVITVVVDQFAQSRETDLLSSTFDINEM
jgi:hypothetical protein